MSLSDVKCRNLKPSEKAVKVSDGGGLHLMITPAGGKLWRLAYRFDGKQKTLALGKYPTISLKAARQARDEAKDLLAKGIDPGAAKAAEKRQANQAKTNSFEAIAREWFEQRRGGLVPGYAARIWSRLEADIFPILGARLIAAIEASELLTAIRAIEERGAVSLAKRTLQVCGQIFRYAVATGRASRDPSHDLKGALRSLGSRPRRAALKADEVPEFLRRLSDYEGRQTALAIKLVMHTFLRTSEIRFGRWDEIDWQTRLWRISAARMKMRGEHIVPLTAPVIEILRKLKTLAADSPFILPAPTGTGVISENTMLFALYRMGYRGRVTVHGFRGLASTVLHEKGWDTDWIELQLAHVPAGVRARYNVARHLDGRREMMNWWSSFLAAQEPPT